MDRLKTLLPIVLSVAALGLVAVQFGTLSSIEDRLQAQTRAASSRVDARPDAPRAQAAVVDTKALASVEARIDDLERDVKSALTLVRRRPAPTVTLPDDASDGLKAVADEIAALRTDVDDLLVGGGLQAPEAQAALEAAATEVQEQRRRERRERRAERYAEVVDEWLGTFAADAGLSVEQAGKLGDIMKAQRTSRQDVRAQVRSGELTRDEAREEMRAQRQDRDDEVRDLLDDEQYEQFNERERELRGRFGGRGGRGGRGGDAGGGGRGGR